MAIFGFKKRKDDKLQQEAAVAKSAAAKGAKKHVVIAKKQESGKQMKRESEALITDKTKPVKAVALPVTNFTDASEAILRPRVTEKSGIMGQTGRYTFEVSKSANKDSIRDAVNALYKVRPIKVAVINTPAKNVFVKGRRGTVAGIRKAIVTLKKGDKIDFV